MKTKEKITKLIDDLHNKVDEFYNSDEWAKYLQFALKFRNRSEFNKLLIWFYGGEDTVYVMGYKQWVQKMNRIVVACTVCRAVANKDCRCEERQAPIRIPQLAPMTYNKIEEDEDGEEKVQKKLFFREVYVFKMEDTEQIDDKPIIEMEEIIHHLNFEVDADLENALTKIINDNEFTYRLDTWDNDKLNGWCDYHRKEIVVHSGRPQAQRIKTLIHEIGHMFAHDSEMLGNPQDPRALRETEAESIAYVVGQFLGMDTSNYSIGYVTGWSSNEDFILKASIETVTKTAMKIIDLLEEARG